MEIIRPSSYQEIEDYLSKLGSFDEDDARSELPGFPKHILISISEREFMDCVFLSIRSTERICPAGQDRRLSAVAERAMNLMELGVTNLGPNWDLAQIFDQSQSMIKNRNLNLGRLVLRDLQGNEQRFMPAFKYIHDGCHRSLGYAILLKKNMVAYSLVEAFLATNDTL